LSLKIIAFLGGSILVIYFYLPKNKASIITTTYKPFIIQPLYLIYAIGMAFILLKIYYFKQFQLIAPKPYAFVHAAT